MAYIPPSLVTSPKSRIRDLEVVCDAGEGKWAVAKFKWDGRPVVGVRWNGGSGGAKQPEIGNPQSRGIPTWFVLPDELAEPVMAWLAERDAQAPAGDLSAERGGSDAG